jgi:dynein heavy chain 1
VLLAEHCELVRGPRQTWSLEPKRALHGDKKTLVVFCDEINLVAPDAYGTPRALAFLRQLVERRGFWALSLTSAKAALEPSKYARTNSGRCPPKWVALKRVSFVAACNPPTDAGRHPLPERLLRHLHVLRVGTPRRASLERVYAAYCDFAGRDAPSSETCDAVKAALHVAMLDVFEANADRFVKTKMPQCVYSARELTRWCRALRAAYDGGGADHDGLSPAASLVRVWAHEGLRLFADRLPSPEDVDWCAARSGGRCSSAAGSAGATRRRR